MLRARLIESAVEFSELEKDWNPLLSQSRLNNVFLTWEWVSNWWKVFSENKRLYIIAFFQDTRLVGLAPLYLNTRKFSPFLKIRELLFIGAGATLRSEYLGIICLPDYERECLDQLDKFFKNSQDWDAAILTDILCESLLGQSLQQRFKRSEIVNREPCYYVDLTSTFDAYLESIDRRMRRNIRNRQRNLERDFKVSYRRLGPEEDLQGWMGCLKRLHAERLRERGLPSKFSDPGYDLFHSRISRIFHKRNWLFAASLSLNGKTVAVQYNFIYNNKAYNYQTGFDPQFSKNGVMQALISYIIEDCARNSIREFDFLAGAEDYKRRFANAAREVASYRLANRTFSGTIYGLVRRLKAVFQLRPVAQDLPFKAAISGDRAPFDPAPLDFVQDP